MTSDLEAAPRRTWSIAVTVVLALVAAITLLLVIAGTVGYRAYRADQWRQLGEDQQILTEQLAIGLASPLWNFDHSQLEALAESGMRDRSVAAISIRLSDDGSLIHARGRDSAWRQMVVSGEPSTEGLIAEQRQILFDGEVIGTVRVAVTPAFLEAGLAQARLSLIALVVALDFALVLGLAFLLWRVVLMPLQQLERFALAVSSRPAGEPVPSPALRFRGELESLRGSLVRMIALLDQRFEAILASEKNFRESEERYRVLMANAPYAMLVADLDAGMRFVEVNESACRLLGARRDQLLALRPIDIYAERDPSGRPVSEAVAERAQLLDAGQQVEQETTIRRLDGGGERLCELRLVSVPIRGRRLIHGTLIDITDRRRNELELAQHRGHLEDLIAARTAELEQSRANAERLSVAAQSANRAKSDFLSKMSHEIRTPLNAVLGYAQLLARSGGLSPDNQRAVEIINRSGEHLLALINDILEMSRIEAGQSRVEAVDFDLRELLATLKELFALPAREKGLDLSIDLAEDLPRTVRSDQRKLRQVLFNLLSNAVKFTAVGEVRIIARYDAARQRLSLSVRDTGPGIPADELLSLFQPFSQSRAGREQGQGTGLGLAICRGFATALRGELTVASTPGLGSEFTLDVPTVAVDGGAAGAKVPLARIAAAPDSARPRILVAEDHADSRRLLADLFLALGFEARTVGDGAAAVAAFREWRPQLVLMDIDMPVMDGLAATAAIRREAGSSPIIVAVTAAAFDEDRKRMLAAGCDEVVRKPYREEELFELMERLLGVRFVRTEAAPGGSGPYLDDREIADRLAAVPAERRRQLRGHLMTGDMPAALLAIDGLEDAGLAGRLRALAAEFAVERMLALLADAPGSKPA
jgi:PAS domain S-box-containing protein